MDNTGPGYEVLGSVENTGSRGLWKRLGHEVCRFVTTAHDHRSHHCHLVSFPKMSKCQARLLMINNRI